MDMLWFTIAALAAAAYCISRSIVDLRAKRYLWGAFGVLSAVFFIIAPVQTHAVKLDLDLPTQGR
jgi:hypothetical protein